MKNPFIIPMTPELAAQAAAWRYPGEYAVYNGQAGDASLLDGSSYAVPDTAGLLVGVYQFGDEAKIPTAEPDPYQEGFLDIGLGLRPDLCGLGFGTPFLLAGLDFARRELGADRFRLTVAAFNRRAQKVYLRCGFQATGEATHKNLGSRFIIMTGIENAGSEKA